MSGSHAVDRAGGASPDRGAAEPDRTPRRDAPAGAIRVLLVDDHAIVREGYRRLLEETPGIRVVAEAASASEAYRRHVETAPDVVVMDVALPDTSGIEATRRICLRDPAARVLVFSMHADAIFVRRALEAGAAGYLSKASAPGILVGAVQAVAEGRCYLGPDIQATLARRDLSSGAGIAAALSAREFEVVRLLAGGAGLDAIADRLGLSAKTIANHQSAIKAKLGVANLAQLVLLARQAGLA